MFDSVPSYYIVNRTLEYRYLDAVMNALRIHPVQCAIISRVADAPLALSISREVIRAADDEHAQSMAYQIASETHRPALVVGEAPFLDAVYESGVRLGVVSEC